MSRSVQGRLGSRAGLRVAAVGAVVALGLVLTMRPRDPALPNPSDAGLVVAVGSPGSAATSIDSLVAAGEARYWEGAFEEARAPWRLALDSSRLVGDERTEAVVLTWLGLAAWRLSEFPEARTLGEEALALKLRLGSGVEVSRSYNALGLLALDEGRLSDAAGLFERAATAAFEEGDEAAVARAANNQGNLYLDLGQFSGARVSFESALAAARRLGDALIEGRVLNNLGMLDVRAGDLGEGIALLARARRLYRTQDDVIGELNALGQLSTAYAEVGEPRRSFALLDSALALARDHGLRSEEAIALELLADLYRWAGEHRRAYELYDEARRVHAELGLRIEEGSDLARQAEVLARLGDVERARGLAARALQIHRTTEASRETLADLLLLGELAQLAGEPGEVTEYLEEARALVRRIDTRTAVEGLMLAEARIADHALDSHRVLEILARASTDAPGTSYRVAAHVETLRARALARVGDPTAAADAGYRAVEAVERIRGEYGSGFLRSAFLADRHAVYADLTDVLLLQGRTEEAFEVADAGRGRAFLDHLKAAIPAAADTADPERAEGDRLLREIGELLLRLDEVEALPAGERDAGWEAQVAGITRELARARSRYGETVIRRAEHGGRRAAGADDPRPRASDVRRALSPDEALLEYVTGEDRVTVFVVTRGGVESRTTRIPAGDLWRHVRLARELAGRPAPRPPPTAVLGRLHQILIAPLLGSPALADVRHLIIVPDPALAHVPFAALRDEVDGRHLIERYAISHLPSAAALALGERGDAAPERGGGPRNGAVFVPFPDELPASAREASAVHRALGRVRVVRGRAATEAAVRRQLASGGIVHVASHGVMETGNPLFSRLELAAAGADPADDGRLETHEVMRLSIRSALVFLSGCETESVAAGLSTFAGGDDYAALARAFLYAGARSVIATLWRIDDEGAAEFAGRFYRHLRDTTAAEALARAQREMIGSDRFGAPYYWAAYRLAGEPETIAQTGDHVALNHLRGSENHVLALRRR